MDMNSPTGKAILALVRKGDYAHAGEEEAIDIVFKNIAKDSQRLLLDVGCGRGGTAQYLQTKGWGKVLGVDIDAESINYAQKAYPAVEFKVADALNLAQDLSQQFDAIYFFNSFYAFSDHLRVLKEARALSRKPGQLIIFDYLLKSQSKKKFTFPEWNPLDFSFAQTLFPSAGWRIIKTDEISPLYEKWYKGLTARIESSAAAIITLAGKEWFEFVRAFYGKIVTAIEKNLLGGAIVYAEAK
jgi:SAM-dependent methyltransferase